MSESRVEIHLAFQTIFRHDSCFCDRTATRLLWRNSFFENPIFNTNPSSRIFPLQITNNCQSRTPTDAITPEVVQDPFALLLPRIDSNLRGPPLLIEITYRLTHLLVYTFLGLTQIWTFHTFGHYIPQSLLPLPHCRYSTKSLSQPNNSARLSPNVRYNPKEQCEPIITSRTWADIALAGCSDGIL